ncbi:MAG: glutamine-hydrolyzing carbamoyl-phosphate synthase small subunit [Candidatus Eisenbacteria bacterium]|uniref:Carbamoyl phosphate synthase small chain n=1 Tax=Eiseniibacteriota bacterium TaxID=2212470 RepID=A0A538TLR8_UNCEI|nr:MAG: glutamine-hydrolyzing carbamoyl-phosphate synthase small subunit [Candidatus Eisenbacteria bacterium]
MSSIRGSSRPRRARRVIPVRDTRSDVLDSRLVSPRGTAPKLERRPRALLALEDGAFFEGRSFGRLGETAGEVVFNTALCGYQEVLTDPSYQGQIVTMTYPHIGNYGVNREDVESTRPQVATRALTRHLRTHGAKRGVISALTENRDELVDRARASRSMTGLDLAREVTCDKPYRVEAIEGGDGDARSRLGGRTFHVVAYDFGIKRNILRMLSAAGCDITVVPATTSAGEALALEPDGIFLSNGPGDPEPCVYAIEAARELILAKPTFGICLGHQIMGLACGGRTFKLKFGHRGANHPVKNLATGGVAITSQNHGFAVLPELFDDPDLELTHVNLNDGTVEGFRHRGLPAFSVQYHPEASPGPHDSHYLFTQFLKLMDSGEPPRTLPRAHAAGVPPGL